MAKSSDNQDQVHPLWASDRKIVDTLLNGQPTDYNLAELARLRIRYHGFPGARDIQRDLDQALVRWQMDEDELFKRTREIHAIAQVYRGKGNQQEDWS